MCENYRFFDQAIEVFEHGLVSILIDSVNTPELDTSIDEADVMHSLVSPGFLHSVVFQTILDCSLLLASSFVNYGARLGLYFCLYQRQVEYQPLS